MRKPFSAAAAIARQQAQIERGKQFYRQQREYAEWGDFLAYYRAELAWQREYGPPYSRERETVILMTEKLVDYLAVNPTKESEASDE